MNEKMAEQILCFPARLLDELGRFQGISFDIARYYPAVVTPPNCHYVRRGEAENNPDEKQIIPYALLIHDNNIFAYRRGKRGGENRLHEKYSVGVGGHIEKKDVDFFPEDENVDFFPQDDMGYTNAVFREVNEEVKLGRCDEANCVALINDDSNDVGKVHFGIVHLFRLAEPRIAKKESSITDADLIPIEKTQRNIARYETWSQLCIKNIEHLMKATCTARPTI